MRLFFRKLSVHDNWTELAVHVAMDMVVVVEDISKLLVNYFVYLLFCYVCRNSVSATIYTSW